MKVTLSLLALSSAAYALQVPFIKTESADVKIIDAAKFGRWDDSALNHVEAGSSWFSLPGWISKALPRPPHPGPPPIIDLSDRTIAEILNDTLYSAPEHPKDGPLRNPPLHKFAFFANLSTSEEWKAKLADPDAQITLFAPDDFALDPHHRHGPGDHEHDGPGHHGPPHRGGPPHHGDHEHHPESVKRHPFMAQHMLRQFVQSESSELGALDEDDDEKKERKERFLRIVSLILQYHLVDTDAYQGKDLINNATIASSLNNTRIRIQPTLFPRPSLVLNFFSRTRGPTLRAKNGFIHLLSAPLLPPLTPLEELFVFPAVFSTLTSGLQKVGVDNTLSPWLHIEDNDEVAQPVQNLLEEIIKEHKEVRSFTVFAPTNRAFFKLGFKLNGFLFSPFGRPILKAILEYHVVPDVAFFTDFVSDVSKISSLGQESVDTLPKAIEEPQEELIEAGLAMPHRSFHPLPNPGEIVVRHYSLKTLFNDTALPVDVYEARRGPGGRGPVRRSIWVGDGSSHAPGSRVQVAVTDGIAYKAAVHVVTSLIRPPQFEHPPHHHGDHEDGPYGPGHHHEGHEHKELNREAASFFQFARALSGKKGCHGKHNKRSNVWDQLLPKV